MSETGTWSYEVTQPTARDRVRFLIGDTVPSLAWVWDEEIEARLLLANNNELVAAAEICEAEAAQSSSFVNYSVGGGSAVKYDLAQRQEHFSARAKWLRKRLYRARLRPETWG